MVAELTGNEIASAISRSGSFGRGFGDGAVVRGFARRSPPTARTVETLPFPGPLPRLPPEVRFSAMVDPRDPNAFW